MAVIPLPLSLLPVARNSFFCQSARTISLQFRRTADYRVCWRRKKGAYQQAPLVQASPSARSGPRRLDEMEQKHCLSPGRLTLIRLPHVCLRHLANRWSDTVSETTWIVQLGSWIAQKKANGKSTFACLNEFTRRLPSIVPQALCTCSCSGSWLCASRVSAQGQGPDQVHRVHCSASSVMMGLPVETHLKAQ